MLLLAGHRGHFRVAEERPQDETAPRSRIFGYALIGPRAEDLERACIAAATRAYRHARPLRKVMTLAATGQLGLAAPGQIQMTVVSRARMLPVG